MRLFTISFAFLLAVQPMLSLARDNYRLPAGKRITVQKETYQGYTLEEMKILLKMDIDLESYSKQIPKYVTLVSDQTRLTANLTKQVEIKEKIIKLLQDERVRLTEKWTEENRLRHIAENKVSWTTWIAWGTAGVATVVATVLAAVLAVKEAR